MIGPRPIPYARTAGAAKEEVGGVAASAGILQHLRFFFAIDADLPGGETDLCGKGAAAARLALAAMADRHADRLACAGHANLTAAAGGVADGLGHFAAFLSATRTSVSRLAPAPSSSLAAATAVLASPGLKPRPVRAATASPSGPDEAEARSEEHTSELQSLMRIPYAVFCLKKKKK